MHCYSRRSHSTSGARNGTAARSTDNDRRNADSGKSRKINNDNNNAAREPAAARVRTLLLLLIHHRQRLSFIFSRASHTLRDATEVVRMPCVCGNFFPNNLLPAQRRDNIPLGILVVLWCEVVSPCYQHWCNNLNEPLDPFPFLDGCWIKRHSGLRSVYCWPSYTG